MQPDRRASYRRSLGELSKFLPDVEREPRLAALAAQIRDKTNWVSDQLDAVQSEHSKRERNQADRERLQSFRKLRRQAQLYGERMWVIEPAEHQKAIRTTAMAALAVFGNEPTPTAETWRLSEPLPEALELAEKDEVKAGCVDLLSILSDAIEPAEGLKVLDCTLRLRPEPTAAYHLRKAALLFKSGDPAGREREEQLARSLSPTTALDHLLISREQLARARNTVTRFNPLKPLFASTKTSWGLTSSWPSPVSRQSGSATPKPVSTPASRHRLTCWAST